MSEITDIFAQEILDSRGNPTVEVEVLLEDGSAGRRAPSGASTGSREARELRDGTRSAMAARGCFRPCGTSRMSWRPAFAEKMRAPARYRPPDDRDGRHAEQGNLGANALLGVSLAVAKAAAARRGCRSTSISAAWPRDAPVPMMNVLNGGRHADNSVDFQEFMIVPLGAPSFREPCGSGPRRSTR